MEGRLAGRYELGDPLGAGGMAEVVRAVDLRLHRPVAVKLLSTARVDADAAARFRREAQTAAGFSHPHAVTTYDAGQDGDWLYLVMELVDGPTLAEHLAVRGALGTAEATRTTAMLLDVLGAAHAAGFVHRDVKPGNVLLGPNDSIKLADFGIARRFDQVAARDMTVAGSFLGTARYASPEQLAGESAGPATDLYSTGIVLYEMLAGRPPFEGESALAIAMAHQQSPVPDVRAVAPAVPPDLAYVVSRAMAKRPADRFPSASAMRAVLLGRTEVAPSITPITPLTPPSPAPVTAAATVAGPSDRAPVTWSPRQRWWWVAAAVLVLIGVGVVVAVARSGDPDELATAATTPSVPTPTTTLPSTTVAPTTAPPTTAAPTTVPPITTTLPVPTSLEDWLATLGLDDRGASPSERQQQRILDELDRWVESGAMDATTRDLLADMLAPDVNGGQDGGGNNGNDNANGND